MASWPSTLRRMSSAVTSEAVFTCGMWLSAFFFLVLDNVSSSSCVSFLDFKPFLDAWVPRFNFDFMHPLPTWSGMELVFFHPRTMVGCTRHRFTPSTFERSSPLLSLRSSRTFPSPSSGSVPELRIAWKCTTKREDKRRLAHHWGNPQNYPYKKGYIKAPCYKMTVWYSRNIQENANPNLQCNELLLLMISWSWASSYQYILNCFIYILIVLFLFMYVYVFYSEFRWCISMHKYA